MAAGFVKALPRIKQSLRRATIESCCRFLSTFGRLFAATQALIFYADRTDAEIRLYVEQEVDERVKLYEEADERCRYPAL